jgi:hypothetical protein
LGHGLLDIRRTLPRFQQRRDPCEHREKQRVDQDRKDRAGQDEVVGGLWEKLELNTYCARLPARASAIWSG